MSGRPKPHPILVPDTEIAGCYTAWLRYCSPVGESPSAGTTAPLALTTEARPLDPRTPISELTIAIFDLETTGLSTEQDRIVEIFVRILHPDGRTWERGRLVNPERPIPEAATRVHRITDAMVAQEPTFAALAPHIVQRLGDAVLVAHNGIKFDVPFLVAELRRAGLDWRPRAAIDTLLVSDHVLPGLKSYSLQNLRKAFGLDGGTAHRAEGDVRTLAALWTLLRQRQPRATLGEWGSL